jgi:predicted GNAT family N-acyltransferase
MRDSFMIIAYSNDLSVEDYCMLRKSVEWGAIPENIVRKAIDKSDFIISATVDGAAVGMARLMTDGTQALIMDVVVHPEYQGKGIGKTMMSKVMEYLNNSLHEGQYVLVNLNATKGRESFYIQFGFEIRPTEILGKGMAKWINSENKI